MYTYILILTYIYIYILYVHMHILVGGFNPLFPIYGKHVPNHQPAYSPQKHNDIDHNSPLLGIVSALPPSDVFNADAVATNN